MFQYWLVACGMFIIWKAMFMVLNEADAPPRLHTATLANGLNSKHLPLAKSARWMMASRAPAPGETAQDSEGLQTMRTLARNMAWMLKSLRAEGSLPHPEKEAQQRTNFIR